MSPKTSDSLDTKARAVLPLTPVMIHILLALVDEDRHGLGVAEHIEAFTGGRLALGPGTLYGAVKRLLDLDLIHDVDADGEDPRRRYYSITPVGRRALQLEAADLVTVLNVARAKKVI